jgi:hypothetical protein
LDNKVIKSSAVIDEDITFAQYIDGLIVLGTIKGNILIYHSESLELLAKNNASPSKISCLCLKYHENDKV